MKLSSIIIQCIVCIYPVAAMSQNTDGNAIIEKTAHIYNEWGGMEVAYAANITSEKNAISQSFEGSLLMKNDKFLLKMPDMTVWFDGKTQWSYMLQNKEVSLSTPSNDELRYLNPLIILRDYKKDFNVSFIGESTSSNAKSAYDIMLIPKKKDDIEKLEMQIEKNNSLPVKLVVTMRNDMRIVVSIKEIKANTSPDNTFTFPENDYPGVEIIDLR